MSYNAFKENTPGYNQFRGSRPPKKPGLSKVDRVVIDDDREEVFKFLMETPIGRQAKSHYEKLESKQEIPLNFLIIEDLSIGVDHGRTDPSLDENGFATSLTVNIRVSPSSDRMKGWTREELINIIVVHESQHVKKSGRVIESPEFIHEPCGKGTPNEDHRRCIHDEPERGIIFKELQARFEFSILYPDRSTSSSGWVQIYRDYFLPKNRNNEDPVLESYLDAVNELYDSEELTLENFQNAVKQKDVAFLVK